MSVLEISIKVNISPYNIHQLIAFDWFTKVLMNDIWFRIIKYNVKETSITEISSIAM